METGAGLVQSVGGPREIQHMQLSSLANVKGGGFLFFKFNDVG
ncbi:hypothetical protein PCURB6_12850 [Paenibacillus curdlanolyticus]|nr:hypothetical protein PCURB6_12850 [Paenibacillus curdlanolyticus]